MPTLDRTTEPPLEMPSTTTKQMRREFGDRVVLLKPSLLAMQLIKPELRQSSLISQELEAIPNAEPLPYAVARPAMARQQKGARAVQEWEGTVVGQRRGMIIARLRDLLHQGRFEETAEIPLDNLSDPDKPLVAEGAVFYWTIGYTVSRGGQRTLASEIRFRRDPCWSASDLRKVEARAREFGDILDEPSP